MSTNSEYSHTNETTEKFSSTAQSQIEKEWSWVNKLPNYKGEYKTKIVDMATTFQHAINLEIEAKRISTGLEAGADGTLEITTQDHVQASQLKAQAHQLRLESVNNARELYVDINKRWNERAIELARNTKNIQKGPEISRDIGFDRER